jgi:hypothetical protein
MPLDMLDRMTLDPGTRTIGKIMQEREWAVSDIRRRLSRKQEASRIESGLARDACDAEKHLEPASNAQRLLRLAEVIKKIGLCRSSIFRYVAEGKFPTPMDFEA